jgi:hypothetical protein
VLLYLHPVDSTEILGYCTVLYCIAVL